MCLNILLLCDFIIVDYVKYIILDFYILNLLTIKKNPVFSQININFSINLAKIQVGPKYTLAPTPFFHQ